MQSLPAGITAVPQLYRHWVSGLVPSLTRHVAASKSPPLQASDAPKGVQPSPDREAPTSRQRGLVRDVLKVHRKRSVPARWAPLPRTPYALSAPGALEPPALHSSRRARQSQVQGTGQAEGKQN